MKSFLLFLISLCIVFQLAAVTTVYKTVDQLVKITSPKSVMCGKNYISVLTSIVGEKFQTTLLNKLLRPSTVKLYPTNAQIVLNIGAGSSGTKSLYVAMQQLNITATHFRLFSKNCTSLYRNSSRSVYAGMPLTYDSKMVFWGDTPVMHRWWWLWNHYPAHQLRFIMTDLDNQKWLRVRMSYHCQASNTAREACYLPSPIAFYPPPDKKIDQELAAAAMMRSMSESSVFKALDAYRSFVRCVIPKDKILWIDFGKEQYSASFWDQLVKFMQVDVPMEKLNQLVQAGVPYFGSKGCQLGGRPCVYLNNITLQTNEGNLTSTIVPSVCL